MKRLGILLSGRRSNFEAIADSIATGRIAAAEDSTREAAEQKVLAEARRLIEKQFS